MDRQIPQGNTTSEVMTVKDVADYLRVSEAKVYRMALDGQIPAFRVGRAWRFKKGQIDDWITQKSEIHRAT
jgi:excisionase family DNA binding protein